MADEPNRAQKVGAAVAQHVMGWSGVVWCLGLQADGSDCAYWGIAPSGRWNRLPDYHGDIAAAWQVVEKMRADGWWYTLTNVQERQEFAEFRRVAREGVHKFHYARGETPQHAICLAALAAVGHKIAEE